MIRSDKCAPALRALNLVLVHARTMSYEKAPHDVLADVLDTAELLPMLFLQDKDNTTFFRDLILGLSEKYPVFQSAVQRFDGEF